MNIHAGEVCLTALPAPLKNEAWRFIKAQRPALKALLDSMQPGVQQFRASVWVKLADSGLTAEQVMAAARAPASPATGA